MRSITWVITDCFLCRVLVPFTLRVAQLGVRKFRPAAVHVMVYFLLSRSLLVHLL